MKWLSAFSNKCTFCSGGFSKTVHPIVFVLKCYMLLLQILKLCNVVLMIEQKWKFEKLLNFEIWLDLNDIDIVCILSRRFLKNHGIHRIIFIFYLEIYQILKKYTVVVLIEKKTENCKNYWFWKLLEHYVTHFLC